MKQKKSTIVLIILLVIAVISLIGIIASDRIEGKKVEDEMTDMLQQVNTEIATNKEQNKVNVENSTSENINNTDNQKSTSEKTTVTINNINVYGKIKIQSINLEYPIVEYNEQNLKRNICNLSNIPINGTGNLCIAGHNTSNGTLFGKIKKVKCGDIIEITNLTGITYTYQVNSITAVQPEENALLQATEESILTLITCTNSAKQRLIVQAQKI